MLKDGGILLKRIGDKDESIFQGNNELVSNQEQNRHPFGKAIFKWQYVYELPISAKQSIPKVCG